MKRGEPVPNPHLTPKARDRTMGACGVTASPTEHGHQDIYPTPAPIRQQGLLLCQGLLQSESPELPGRSPSLMPPSPSPSQLAEL